MRKRTARSLRRIADRLDPKPARWYATRTSGTWSTNGLAANQFQATIQYHVAQPKRRRVLADYLTSLDLKKLRP